MTDELLHAKKAAAAAEAAFTRAVAAYQEMATGRHREGVSSAIAEIGLTHARAAALEHRDVPPTAPPNDAATAFDTAFAVARRAAVTAARWAGAFAAASELGEGESARAIGDDLGERAAEALGSLHANFAKILGAAIDRARERRKDGDG